MKGKYAARASNRREDQAVRAEADSYQHNIRRLTAENADLSDKLAALQQQHRDETRRLRAERDEGLSPEVRALRAELARQRDRADGAVKDNRDTQEKWHRLVNFTARVLHDATGCTGLEAIEQVTAAAGHDPALITAGVQQEKAMLDRPASELTTIQRTRGYRSSAKVSKQLADLASKALDGAE